MIYVASSWRNSYYDGVIDNLSSAGYEFYDFKDNEGFSWASLDPEWQTWETPKYLQYLRDDPKVERGYLRDQRALDSCDGLLMVTPCGRSAHLELGYVAGQNKSTCIMLSERQEPELMYRMAHNVVTSITDVFRWIERYELGRP